MNPSAFCDQCNSRGLPIMPVRYAVAPSTVQPALPGWASGARVKDVLIGRDFHYVLRTLRAGYIYLFYDKNARGSRQWECYAVSVDGSLLRQPSPTKADPTPPGVFTCARHGKNNAQVHYLVIEQPHKCGPAWIAFSEHKWSDETIAEYTTNTGLRNARMQTIHPAAMATGAKHSHGAIVDQAALEGVVEYGPQGVPIDWPYDSPAGTLSKEDGSYDGAKLRRMSTRYPWFARTGAAQGTAQHMHARGLQPDGRHDKPHVLALWDAVGITHELNGMRNDVAGRIAQYGQERELQIGALSAIESVKHALEQRMKDNVDRHLAYEQEHRSERTKRDAETLEKRRANASRWSEPARSRELETCDLMADWNRRGYPLDLVFGRVNAINSLRDPQRTQQLQALRAEVEADLAAGRQSVQAARDGVPVQAARDWQKYEDRLDRAALLRFKQNRAEFESSADRLIDKRTVSLTRWLEAPLLIDTLEDYHETSIEDGVVFEDVVGQAIFGIGSSASGAAKLDEWIREAKASVKSNLVWRAVALNQQQSIAEVDEALAAAVAHTGTPLTEAAVSVALANLKNMQRLADTYKKAQSVYNTNTKASSAAGNRAFGVKLSPVNARGVDVLAITIGDRIYKALGVAKVGDFVGEKVIQMVFSLRAFVEPADAIALVKAQARTEGVGRAQTLERVRTARAFLQLSPSQTGQAKELTEAWSKFKNTHADGPANFKDARLAIVVGMIEGANFAKLAQQSQGDARSRAMVAASGLTIMAALADVAAAPAKSLFGSDSWTHQRLKLLGGVLGGVASMVGAGVDLVDAETAASKDQRSLRRILLAKAVVGGLGGAVTLASTFTYAAPAIQRLTGSAAVGTAARVIGERAMAVIAARILIMSAGAWITFTLVVLQVVIWRLADDALQIWCDECVFGKHRKYKTVSEQQLAFDKAVLDVL